MHSEKNSATKEETVLIENRSSHQRYSMKKDVLKNFTKFTGRSATLLKRRLWQRCFPNNFANDGCKNLQRFIFKLLKPFCLSSERGFKIFSNYKKLATKLTFPGKCFINKSL